MGIFGVAPSTRNGSQAITSTFSPRGSVQSRPLSTEVNGYQFPKCQLPNARGKIGSEQSPKNTTMGVKRPTTLSGTTAPLYPDRILPNLYISDLETACAVLSPNYSSPGRPKIKYVLSLLESAADQPKAIESTANSDYVLKLIVIQDWTDTDLIKHLPEARDFIKESLQADDGGVLVHCRKGISRSGSVMIAYVMEALDLGYEAALVEVQKFRPKVHPNIGFQNQLKLWKSLNYTLTGANEQENDAYTEWKLTTKLRNPLTI